MGENETMNVLITGGAGYIGSMLVPELLAVGYNVRVYDSLLFGGNSMLPHFRNPCFSLVQGDIRDTESLRPEVEWADVVIHLAAIVGYPACEKDHRVTTEVNYDATARLVDLIKDSDDKLVLFGSTGSNYGKVDGICTEESPLNPLSLYGVTKTNAEKYIMDNCEAIAYRFATAFGLSPRLRLDLLVNDFTNKAINDKYIVVYESHFMRTFIHVHVIARSFMFGIRNRYAMRNDVYNVGSDDMNFSKADVCKMIKNVVPYHLHLADIGSDADQRDYVVSYSKVKSMGFRTKISLDAGIKELADGIRVIKRDRSYSNV